MSKTYYKLKKAACKAVCLLSHCRKKKKESVCLCMCLSEAYMCTGKIWKGKQETLELLLLDSGNEKSVP